MKYTFLTKTILAVFISAIGFVACKKDRTTVLVNNNPGKTPTSYPVNILGGWTKQAPKKQSFTMNADGGGWVTGAKGCRFYFPPAALLDMSNNAVTGNVEIELIEYMNKADMLFSGVTVTAGNELLESGGMFYLMARKNGAELHLKDNSGFMINIPQTNNNMEPMDFWAGEPNQDDSLNKVNWVKQDTVAIVPRKDTAAQGRATYSMMFDYFKFGYCNIDREMNKFKTLVTKFRIKLPEGCNDTNSTALLLFKNYNCCAWCFWFPDENRMSTYYSLPQGETAKVLIYKKTGKNEDDLEYAVKEFTFTDVTEVEFTTLSKCTNQQLEDVIKGL
jgi:hypothetical protein